MRVVGGFDFGVVGFGGVLVSASISVVGGGVVLVTTGLVVVEVEGAGGCGERGAFLGCGVGC